MTAVRKHKSDRTIIFCTLTLLALGLIIIYAIGPMRANVLNNAYGADYGANDFFFNQLRSVILSIAALFVAFKLVPLKFVHKAARPFMYFALALSALLWFLALIGSPLAKCELGECRWFNIPIISSIQPAEFLKIGLVLYLADFLTCAKAHNEIGKLKEFWLPLLLVCGASLLLVIIAQGDLGTGVALIAIILGMLLACGVPAKQYLLMLVIIVVGAVGATITSEHRMERIDAWVAVATGSEDIDDDTTYHIENAMMAIGAGGFFGAGIGNSVQATGYLPESINDSIIAIVGETFGFIGLTAIIAFFAVLLLRTLKVAEQSSGPEDNLLAVGVFSWLLSQVVVNIMAMTGLIPVTGITFPLISYGGTSMVCVCFAIGLVLQVSCYTSRRTANQISGARSQIGDNLPTPRTPRKSRGNQ